MFLMLSTRPLQILPPSRVWWKLLLSRSSTSRYDVLFLQCTVNMLRDPSHFSSSSTPPVVKPGQSWQEIINESSGRLLSHLGTGALVGNKVLST